MAKDQFNDPKLPNIEAEVQFLLKGKPVLKGEVVSKKAFQNNAQWQNLVYMDPARAKETDKPVGKPKATKTDKTDEKSGMPGSKK
jgi:hypothetical protein